MPETVNNRVCPECGNPVPPPSVPWVTWKLWCSKSCGDKARSRRRKERINKALAAQAAGDAPLRSHDHPEVTSGT
jgi:hypothetical protein